MTDSPYAEADHRERLDALLSQLLHDITTQHGVRNVEGLRAVASFLVAHSACLVSDTSVKNKLRVGVDQAGDWRRYMQQAFLIATTEIDTNNAAIRRRNPRKVYVTDPGMMSIAAPRHTQDLGHRAETAVHAQLARRPGVRLTYFREAGTGRECDFVVRDGAGAREVLQVCYGGARELPEREIPGLLAGQRATRAEAATIVTSGTEWTRRIEGVDIRAVPLWTWLFEESDRWREA